MSIRKWTALLALCIAVSMFCLIYPVYVIRPWRHQGAVELRAALDVLRFRPWAMGVAAVFALASAVQCWCARPQWWKRGLVALAASLVLAFTALSRVNIYELMFHPVDRPAFIPASAAKPSAWQAWRGPIRSEAFLITTWLTTALATFPSWRPIERSVTPVWCGARGGRSHADVSPRGYQQSEFPHA